MSPATERIFEDVAFEFVRDATEKEEMQIVDADMMSQSVLYDEVTEVTSLYVELQIEALYETKETSDARDKELKEHVEDVFRTGVNDFTAQLRAESTYFDGILGGSGSSSGNNNNNNNGGVTTSSSDVNDKSSADDTTTSSSNNNNNNNNNNNSGGGSDSDSLVVHPAFWVAGTLCAVAILSVIGFAYTYVQHRRNLYKFKAMANSVNGGEARGNDNNNNNNNNSDMQHRVHAKVADDAAASDISSLPDEAYFHCSPSVDSTSMLPPTVILEREHSADTYSSKYKYKYHDHDDVERGMLGGSNNKQQQQSVASASDVSDYDFLKAGMRDTGVSRSSS